MIQRIGDAIYLPRGDTGEIDLTPEFAADTMVFTLDCGLRRVVTADEEGKFVVRFDGTEDIPVGSHRCQARYYANPVFDEDGLITGADEVNTPRSPTLFGSLEVLSDG